MATTLDLAPLQTLTIKQLKAQLAELTGQSLKSNNRPYLIGKLTKALEAKAAAEAEQARQAKKTKTTRQAATTKAEKTPEKAEKAERRTRTAQRKAGERDPRLPAAGTVLERGHTRPQGRQAHGRRNRPDGRHLPRPRHGESRPAHGAHCKELGLATPELTLPVRKLLTDGNLRVKGEKRATQYYPAENGGTGAARASSTHGKHGSAKVAGKKGARKVKANGFTRLNRDLRPSREWKQEDADGA